MIEALNCPFCGKSVTVKIIPKEQNDNYVLRLVVKCKDCGVEMSKTITNYPHYSIEYDADAVVDEISKLVDRWDKRNMRGEEVCVIRCKNCKWFNEYGCAIRIVDESDKPSEDDYCSFAERKNE